MYEKNLLLYRDIEKSTSTDASGNEDSGQVVIDYSEIEKAMYNALKRLDTENKVQEQVYQDNIESDLVQFASGTDARLMTCSTTAAPTSSAQQSTAYLLDIRNILLLFLIVYFLITMYSKIKNLLLNYYTND